MNNCKYCGNPVNNGEKFCRNCGANLMVEPVINQPSQQAVVETQPVENQMINQNNKGSDKKNLIILIAIVIILALGLAVGYLLVNKDKDGNTSNDSPKTDNKVDDSTDTKKEDTTNTNDTINNKKEDTTSTNNNDNTDTTYTYKNFKFNKVNGFTYTTSTQGLQITNLKDVIVLDVVAGDFDLVKQNTSTVESTFKNQGYEIENVEVKKYNGIEYITSEVTKDSIKMLILYTKADDDHTFVIGVTNTSFTIDYDVINTVNKIINGTVYEG